MRKDQEEVHREKIEEMIGDLRLYINDNLTPGIGRRYALESLNDCQSWSALRLDSMRKDRDMTSDIYLPIAST